MLDCILIRRPKKKPAQTGPVVLINEQIRAPELRVIDHDGENLGVIPRAEAIKRAKEAGLDLIEISGKANPPIARIGDYGKHLYELKKKQKEAKAKAHTTETKSAQVKIGTGEHDMQLKAKRVAAWLKEGHRVKIDLFLWGRYKYMEFNFLKERLERFLKIIPENFKIADEIKKSPKGLTTTIEVDRSKKSEAPKEGSNTDKQEKKEDTKEGES